MFDLNKPYQCRNGAQARVTKGPDGRLYGWMIEAGDIIQRAWTSEGKAFGFLPVHDPRAFDLINTPQHHTLEVWLNIYPDGYAAAHPDRAEADRQAAILPSRRIACLHIIREFEEGEGLK